MKHKDPRRVSIVQRKSVSGKYTNLYSCVVDGEMMTEADTLERIFMCLRGQKEWDY